MRRHFGAWVIPAVMALGTPARAQPVAPTPSGTQQEAQQRFQRALELADDGNFDAALLELRRAYELAPTYRILYNIGLIYQQLKEYARAYDALEQYLREGGDGAEHAADAKKRIEHLEGRVAYLTVTTNVPNADVAVDDFSVGKTPLVHELRVNSGQRKLTVSVPGRPAQSRLVEVAGGEHRALAFELRVVASVVIQESRSPLPYIAWGTTILLAAGAATTGGFALAAAGDYDRKAALPPSQSTTLAADLSSAYETMRALSITTDALIGATAVVLGLSLYLTLKPSKTRQERIAHVWIVPGGVVGTF